MAFPHRFVEACALLPMLFVPSGKPLIVSCSGSCAEVFAADCLRWRDVSQVFLAEPPLRIRDRRITVGTPPRTSCAVIVLSPGDKPDAFLPYLLPDGVINVSTRDAAEVAAMLKHLRSLFPRAIVPWREYTPEAVYGALASPSGAPKRQRHPPGGARRLTDTYLPCLFTFGADEMTMIFGLSPAPPKPAPTPVGAFHG